MTPQWLYNHNCRVINEHSKVFQLDPKLVTSIIQTESEGDPYALRFEPKFTRYYQPAIYATKLRITLETEIKSQAFSYGLMQLMGATLRGLQFEEHFGKIYDERLNVYYGCKHLDAIRKTHPDMCDIIATYNFGHVSKEPSGAYTNEAYVDKVLSFYKSL